MRGADIQQLGMFSVVSVEARVPADHPIRKLRVLVDTILHELDPLLSIACPTILYPYAREAIADLVTRAGFPPVVLQPMSFEQIYLERQRQGGDAPRIQVPQ